ncbi:MAG: Uma2 family endonuclease [Phormidesmis sp.]
MTSLSERSTVPQYSAQQYAAQQYAAQQYAAQQGTANRLIDKQSEQQWPFCQTPPTMYDLPSEFPEEPGLPDEFHDLQPQLLSRTLSLKNYASTNRFTGSDLNVYYDIAHPLWHKRPDWFLALDVPRVYEGERGKDSRMSYVVWQEGRSPAVIVEFLSYRTEREDLGRFYGEADFIADPNPEIQKDLPAEVAGTGRAKPPSKVEMYEQYLKVPHYIVDSKYTQRLRYFKHNGSIYEEQPVAESAPKIWLADLEIGLGLWDDYFEELPGPWLRWCDSAGNWLLTDTERAQAEANRLKAKLRELGIDPNQL